MTPRVTTGSTGRNLTGVDYQEMPAMLARPQGARGRPYVGGELRHVAAMHRGGGRPIIRVARSVAALRPSDAIAVRQPPSHPALAGSPFDNTTVAPGLQLIAVAVARGGEPMPATTVRRGERQGHPGHVRDARLVSLSRGRGARRFGVGAARFHHRAPPVLSLWPRSTLSTRHQTRRACVPASACCPQCRGCGPKFISHT